MGGRGQARAEDRVPAALGELTAVLRDLGGEVTAGINKLLNELQQERQRRGEEIQALREQASDNRRGRRAGRGRAGQEGVAAGIGVIGGQRTQ